MTPIEPPQQPTTLLWRVMADAFIAGVQPGHGARHGYAAELRAVRDYLHTHTALSLDTMELLAQEISRAEAGE